MKKPRYNYIHRLIDRITKSGQSNNDSFTYYGHLVALQSGTRGYVSVTLYKAGNRYGGELADFSFDYWTLELHFVKYGRKDSNGKHHQCVQTFLYSPDYSHIIR